MSWSHLSEAVMIPLSCATQGKGQRSGIHDVRFRQTVSLHSSVADKTTAGALSAVLNPKPPKTSHIPLIHNLCEMNHRETSWRVVVLDLSLQQVQTEPEPGSTELNMNLSKPSRVFLSEAGADQSWDVHSWSKRRKVTVMIDVRYPCNLHLLG